MKYIFAFFIALFFSASNLLAQVPSSKIMDAAVEWSGSNGIAKVYLTDIAGLTGLQIGLGNSADTMNLMNTQYSITGNAFGAGGVVSENILSIPIGSYATNTDYYVRFRVMLSNGQYNEIEIHSHD